MAHRQGFTYLVCELVEHCQMKEFQRNFVVVSQVARGLITSMIVEISDELSAALAIRLP
jgi:hypothetical protein